MKKIASVFTSAVLALSFAIPASAASPDTTPPVLKKVELSKTAISDGSSVRVYITATDDMTGVKSVSIHGQSPSGNQNFGYSISTKDTQGRWYTDVSIPKYAEGGVWTIDSVSLVDGATNHSYFDDVATFTVNSTKQDTTAPKLTNVSFDKSVVNDGSSYKVYVVATDDLSGIKTASVRLESPSGSQCAGTGLTKDSSGRWYATIKVPTNAEGGVWNVTDVSLTDTVGNHSDFDSSNATLPTITVNSKNVDTAPPALNTVTKSTYNVKAGSSITVYIAASDDKTGVKSVSIEAESQSGNQTFGSGVVMKDPWDRWFIKIDIPKNAEVGTWKIHGIYLTDGAGNRKEAYNGTDFDGNFQVTQ